VGFSQRGLRFLSFGIWHQSENDPLLPSPVCNRCKSLVYTPPGGNSFRLWNYVTPQKTAFRPLTSCCATCPNSLSVLSFFGPIEQVSFRIGHDWTSCENGYHLCCIFGDFQGTGHSPKTGLSGWGSLIFLSLQAYSWCLRYAAASYLYSLLYFNIHWSSYHWTCSPRY